MDWLLRLLTKLYDNDAVTFSCYATILGVSYIELRLHTFDWFNWLALAVVAVSALSHLRDH